MCRGTGFVPLLGYVLVARGETLARAGRPDDAATAIREAIGIFGRKEWLTHAGRARVLLAELER
jgi:hypothetical protein